MDSLLRQGNCFEDFDILNFIKILFKFAFVFKIFEYFCLFLNFTTLQATEAFQVFQMGYLT